MSTSQVAGQRLASLYNAAQSNGCKLLLLLTYLLSYLLTYLLIAIKFSRDGSSPYTSTDQTNKNKYT